MTIRVLTDGNHHADLYESLVMLVEDRFGWELFRPLGMEYWDEGFWNWERHMSHGEPVARQNLQAWGSDRDMGDYSERDDTVHPGRVIKMLTLAQVRDLKPDIIIATLAENEEGLHRLAQEVGAKFGLQLGNQGTVNRYDLADFSLISTTRESMPWTPWTQYRQEFSLEDFRFEYPPSDRTYVGTWVQVLPSDETEYNRFLALARDLPEARMRYHGHVGQVDDFWGGNVSTTREVAAQMRSAGVGYHCKKWSDGYGHVIHDLFAVGKPIVGTASYYADKLAGPLFVEGVTSWNVQAHSHDETVAFIRRLLIDDDLHERMSRAAHARFTEIVNFDNEFEQIKHMLDNVMSDRLVAQT